MQRSAFIPVLLLTALLAPGPLLAQEHCQASDTVGTCLDRFFDSVIQAGAGQEWQALMSQPTGIDTGGANLTTSTKDMMPRMALSGVVGQGSSAQSKDTVLFDLNFSISKLLGGKGANDAQLQGLASPQPQLSDAIRNALPEAQRDDLAGKLQGRIGGLGDSVIRFTYNRMSRNLGRNWAWHDQEYKAMCRTAIEEDALKALAADPKLAGITLPGGKELKDITLKDLPPGVLPMTEEKGRELAAAYNDVLAAKGLNLYHQLLNNQPQLHVTAERKFRDPLVGPDEFSGLVTFEWSPMSLNAAVPDKCREGSPEKSSPDKECLHKYTDWMNGKESAVKEGDRISFRGEYSDVRGETVDPRLSNIIPIVLKPVRKLSLSLVLSRNFTLFDGEPVKADLEGKYENFSNDPARQDRGVVSLTFTRMIGTMQAAAAIVYANHSEFLTGVDARLSAHIGLRIGMFNGAGNNP